MLDLRNLLLERVASGLKRQSLTQPSRWACAVRVMGRPYPGPWTFTHHPWLEEMHDSKAELNIGQKGAQLGFTETVLNITFFKIDVQRTDCLYVLPAKTPDASDFSASRFDPALELSPHLTNIFSEVKNIGHKRAGTTNLYIRGSKSRAGLKSVPAGFIVLDELDEFKQDNIKLALERASGQTSRQVWMLSTPSIENFGINKYFQLSTQEHYFFKCPSCSRFTELTFPESLVITAEHMEDPNISRSHIICKECLNTLPHQTKISWLANNLSGQGSGHWVSQYPDHDARGFHVNQLYSSTVTPAAMATSYMQSLNDPADEQSFWNDKMGSPHTVAGAKINNQHLDICKQDYQNGYVPKQRPNTVITAGIDVGKLLHYEVDLWRLPTTYSPQSDLSKQARPRVVEIGTAIDFEELDKIMYKWRVMAAVIDANPERRKAFEFSQRFRGHVYMCFYGRGINGKQINQTKTSDGEPTITVDRTSWLDLSLGRFRNNEIEIPRDTPPDYYTHLKSLTRKYEKDSEGNPIGRYIKSSIDDHFAHSRNYAEIALPFAAHLSNPHNIRNPI